MSDNTPRKVLLAHGGGGRMMGQFIRKTVLPRVGNEMLNRLTDAATLELGPGSICFTTDSFVVQPLVFPGGDIGKLAVCGTVNDLAVSGARPVALSLALILEEGFSLDTLEEILASAAATARQAGVAIVTGDTKVVEEGAADGLFINTAGIGVRHEGVRLGFEHIRPGDKLIINGTIGDHGMTILSRRKGIRFETPLVSDCASLAGLTGRILDAVPGGVRFMRDPTRGGLAAVLNEIVAAAGCDIEILESSLPVNATVQAAADMLGFDVLNIANEGKVLIVAAAEAAEQVLQACRQDVLGREAAVIGEVREATGGGEGVVELVTKIGGRRVVQMPYGRELPRIC